MMRFLAASVAKLRELGWESSTRHHHHQDHNHSTVSGEFSHYPLRAIVRSRRRDARDPHGLRSVGFVRTAELLTRDG
jgi:hypothetical protein